MKITRELKGKYQLLLLKIVIGQINDLEALAEALEAIAAEARAQNDQKL